LRGAKRVAFNQELQGKRGPVCGEVHRSQRPLMRFGVGLFAVRAAETEQPVSMFSEALTNDVASLASHCFGGFCFVNHG
jgi:hypothetical protein